MYPYTCISIFHSMEEKIKKNSTKDIGIPSVQPLNYPCWHSSSINLHVCQTTCTIHGLQPRNLVKFFSPVRWVGHFENFGGPWRCTFSGSRFISFWGRLTCEGRVIWFYFRNRRVFTLHDFFYWLGGSAPFTDNMATRC